MMTAHTLTAALGGALGGMLHRPRPEPHEPCPASGWAVHHACTDHGQTICPVCTEPVGGSPHPTFGDGVFVIRDHSVEEGHSWMR